MVSLEGLTKVVDPSQLTADFDGSLDYNHEEWIEVKKNNPPLTFIESSHYLTSPSLFTFLIKGTCGV